MLRLEPDAGAGSGTSVERFAASSVAAGVSVGCAGGSCLRLVTGLREPHPEKQTQRIQRTQSSQRNKVAERSECWWPQNPESKAEFAGRDGTGIDSAEFLNGPLAS